MLRKLYDIYRDIVLCTAVLLLLLLVAPKLFGMQTYSVLSGSMAPAIPTGAICYIEKKYEEIQVGDVIAFYCDGTSEDGERLSVLHRVVNINEGEDGPTYVTKGDANETNDAAPVASENIIGVERFAMPYVGYAAAYINSNLGRYVAFIVVLSCILPTIGEGIAAKRRHRKKLNDNAQEIDQAIVGDGSDDLFPSGTADTWTGHLVFQMAETQNQTANKSKNKRTHAKQASNNKKQKNKSARQMKTAGGNGESSGAAQWPGGVTDVFRGPAGGSAAVMPASAPVFAPGPAPASMSAPAPASAFAPAPTAAPVQPAAQQGFTNGYNAGVNRGMNNEYARMLRENGYDVQSAVVQGAPEFYNRMAGASLAQISGQPTLQNEKEVIEEQRPFKPFWAEAEEATPRDAFDDLAELKVAATSQEKTPAETGGEPVSDKHEPAGSTTENGTTEDAFDTDDFEAEYEAEFEQAAQNLSSLNSLKASVEALLDDDVIERQRKAEEAERKSREEAAALAEKEQEEKARAEEKKPAPPQTSPEISPEWEDIGDENENIARQLDELASIAGIKI